MCQNGQRCLGASLNVTSRVADTGGCRALQPYRRPGVREQYVGGETAEAWQTVTMQRLVKIKHDRRDLGFFSAQVVRDDPSQSSWCLRVESPADLDEFRSHLVEGTSMALTMVTREGEFLRGEACVANVSDSYDAATMVTLSGLGPLYKS